MNHDAQLDGDGAGHDRGDTAAPRDSSQRRGHHLEYRRTLRAPMQRFQCLALGPSEETKEKSERARVPAKNAKNDDQGTAASAKNPNMNGFERLSHSLGDWGTPAWGECSA